jgi:hypothetical protein
MFLLRRPAAALWLLAAAGVSSTGPAWAANTQTGKLHPWVLVAAFWGAALLSVSVHYLRQLLAQVAVWARRSWHRSAPERARLLWHARLTVGRAASAFGRSARQLIHARRASGALLGWSRSALRALRA